MFFKTYYKRLLAAAVFLFIIGDALVMAQDHPQKPFVSDGCTLMTDHWHFSCCVAHDRAYWTGGVAAQRLKADEDFYVCVLGKSGPVAAKAMYYAVRLGGHPVFPTTWRWDFGRPYKFGY